MPRAAELTAREPEPLPNALRRLDGAHGAAVAAPAVGERIALDPEDLGVPVYEVRGRLWVIGRDVEAALGYGERVLGGLLRSWPELHEGEDFAVVSFAEAKEMLAKARVRSDMTLNPRGLTVLFERGFDLVLQKTEKPEGQRLRRRLAEEVLPKLRRGQAVGPTGQAAPVASPELEGRVGRIEGRAEPRKCEDNRTRPVSSAG